jgi:lycopene beta-cyclase
MAMTHYDFILVGGGAAGLSLAYRLAHSPLRERSALIVDKDAKERNDRTWCFWTDRPTPFDGIVHRSWSRLRFLTEDVDAAIDLGTYRYQMIRGIDFYRFVRQEITARMPVEMVQGTVDRIEDGPTGAVISVDGRTYAGRWVFDSRFGPTASAALPARYHDLQQHFTGWEVATPRPVFNPQAATFLDFRTPQAGAMRFLYVLPFTTHRALVEYVACTTGLLDREEHERALATYLRACLGIADYCVVAREGGTNPLTDRSFPRRIGRHVMAIGALGGRVKPSSGYAFMRIQQDSAAIVASLLRTGHPFNVPHGARRYRWYDAAMLEVMAHQGERIKPIFTSMFTRNPIGRIFRFLDERSSPWDDLRLAATLPPMLALRAVVHRWTA